jgi:hypothetical protein
MGMLGAQVVLTNPAHKASGMVIKAKELADQRTWEDFCYCVEIITSYLFALCCLINGNNNDRRVVLAEPV